MVVFPVRWEEPFGLVPIEAMGVGRPVVSTARGGSAEFLRPGENALVFEAGDPQALAAAVTRVASDRELRERLLEGGRQTAADHTIERFADETVQAIVSRRWSRCDVTETSVILCVRNGAGTIAEQLAALAAQEYAEPWELVVVDNGSTDGTVGVVRRWEARLPMLTIVPAVGAAGAGLRPQRRRWGGPGSRCWPSATPMTSPTPGGWARLAAGAREADLVGGRLELASLNGELARAWRARPEPLTLPTALGYLPYAVGANFAIRQAAFQAAGGCDERFTVCGDDLDLSWRVQRGGGSLLFCPDAIMHYRLRTDVRVVMRQRYRYGQAEALLRRKFSDDISPVAPRARARSVVRMLARSRELARGAGRRGAWLADASHLAGQLSGSARYRVLA